MATFETLRIWQEAHRLMIEIHNISKLIPLEDKSNLRNQIERSSSSVVANIAEGYCSYYYRDKIRIMYIARKESGETQSHIKTMEAKKYLQPDYCGKLCLRYEELMKGINAYIKYIKKKQSMVIR